MLEKLSGLSTPPFKCSGKSKFLHPLPGLSMCGRLIFLALLAIVSAPCRVTDIVDMVVPTIPVLARSTKSSTRSGCFDGVYTVRGMRSVLYPLDCECGISGGTSTVCLEALDEALEMDERALLMLFHRLGCSWSLDVCT